MVSSIPQDTSNKSIKVVIADDHPSFREGLSRIIAEESDIAVISVVSNGQEAVRAAAEFKPDVVVLDVRMPDMDGIEATRQIKATCPGTSIVILSAYVYESYVLAAMQAGAAAYLTKTVGIREIVGAIRAAHAGETVLGPGVARKIFEQFSQSAGGNPFQKGTPKHLLARELEVLKLGAQGLSNKEIAARLVISERTIHTHFANIFRKLGVGSRTEAVLHALREGWITIDNQV